MGMLCVLLFLLSLGKTSSFLLDPEIDSKWIDFKVTWGPKVDNPKAFVSMPRTSEDALDQGFKKISDCDEKANWRGSRYVKDDDTGAILLYDVNGIVAGIQTIVPSTSNTSSYPGPDIQPPLIKDGDNYLLTAYFVNPATICKKGRSEDDLITQGTGDNLYIQNGTKPEVEHFVLPLKETGMAGTKWWKGSCVPTMGQHYWYNPSEGMNCNNLFPMFPVYNDGFLTGFGWAIGTKMTSKRLDFPFITPSSTDPLAQLGMNPVTKCLTSFPTLSSMHVYFKSDIKNLRC